MGVTGVQAVVQAEGLVSVGVVSIPPPPPPREAVEVPILTADQQARLNACSGKSRKEWVMGAKGAGDRLGKEGAEAGPGGKGASEQPSVGEAGGHVWGKDPWAKWGAAGHVYGKDPPQGLHQPYAVQLFSVRGRHRGH